jgi:glycolate oxidase FAD binding subunit
MDAKVVLSELRERVVAAHQQRQPLRLRGAGTKDFYGENGPEGAAPAADGGQHVAYPPQMAGGDNRSAARGEGGDAPAAAATLRTSAAATTVQPGATRGLDLRPYRGIVDYEPSELVITARCGTPLSEIEAALADRGQFLAFEPPAFGADPTIGGVIAAGLSGPRRIYAGAARDFVLGATLLDAHGDILRFGGQVMKNVAGFDVSRLLCGSLGILGIITEVSLKVLPRPRAEETLRLEMPAKQAVEAFNRWSGQPLPLSGAAWWDGVAWVRLSGAASAVHAAQERLGGERVDPTAATQWWNALRHCQHPIFESNKLWRLSLPDTAPPLSLPNQPLIDWGGALRWYAADPQHYASAAPGAENAASMALPIPAPSDIGADIRVAPGDIRSIASAAGGTAMCWRGAAPAGGRFHPLQPTVATLTRRLKDRFDPHGIFNPGRMIAGL